MFSDCKCFCCCLQFLEARLKSRCCLLSLRLIDWITFDLITWFQFFFRFYSDFVFFFLVNEHFSWGCQLQFELIRKRLAFWLHAFMIKNNLRQKKNRSFFCFSQSFYLKIFANWLDSIVRFLHWLLFVDVLISKIIRTFLDGFSSLTFCFCASTTVIDAYTNQ